MPPLTMPSSPPIAWSALDHPVFRRLWLGGVLRQTGAAMQDVSAGWLMTMMTASPIPVALLQTAASLPVVVLALAGGATADAVNRRRLMVTLQLLLAAAGLALSVTTWQGALTPERLLAGVCLLSCAESFFTPAWMRTVPDVLSGAEIPSGVILNSTAVNLARVLGGFAGGLLILNSWPAGGFLMSAVASLILAGVISAWAGPSRDTRVPAERIGGALWAGLRYLRHSPPHRAVYVRTLAFIIGGSAIPALMPAFARRELHLDGLGFGLLTAAFGIGALLGATLLNGLRASLSAEAIVTAMSLVLAGAALLLAQSASLLAAVPLLMTGGLAWVSMVAMFGVSTGSASPPWVLSRSLSVYMLVFQGGAAVGGIVWGQAAAALGVRTALATAAAILVAGLATRAFVRMPNADPHQLAASQHWPAPPAVSPADASGTVLVTVEYRIDPAQAHAFEEAIEEGSRERLRDGAFDWTLYRDPAREGSYLEAFHVENWLEHIRQHARVTHADQRAEAQARSFHIGPEPPRVTHYIARRG